MPRKQLTPLTCVGDSGDKDKRALIGYETFNSSKEDISLYRRGLMPIPESHALAKRDTLTLGPLVTIPDSFLKCPREGGGKNFCVMCSMFGKEVSDNEDSKREFSPLFTRDEGDSYPYYPPGDSGVCYDSDSSLFERADLSESKKMKLSFVNGNKEFTYLTYPRCNSKNDGPSGIAKVSYRGICLFHRSRNAYKYIKWYLPEFMLSSSQNINDNRRCSAKTTKQNSVQAANNDYIINNNKDLPASDFRTEHVFEVHMVKHFLEWVCGGKGTQVRRTQDDDSFS